MEAPKPLQTTYSVIQPLKSFFYCITWIFLIAIEVQYFLSLFPHGEQIVPFHLITAFYVLEVCYQVLPYLLFMTYTAPTGGRGFADKIR